MENIPLAQIRQLLDEAYSDEEIEVLSFDHFVEVYNNFTSGMTKVQKLLRLLSYCQSRDRIPEIVALLEQSRPGLIERRFPEFSQQVSQDTTIIADLEGDSIEEIGLLDAVESFEDQFRSVTVSLERMREATQDISDQMSSGTAQVNALQDSGNTINPREAKRVVNRTADDLEVFAKRMESEAPIFSSAFQNGISTLNKAMTLFDEFGNSEEQIAELLSMLQQLETSIDSSDAPTLAFRNTIAQMPKITTTFNRAKRHAVGALDLLLVELAKNKAMVRDAQGILTGLRSS